MAVTGAGAAAAIANAIKASGVIVRLEPEEFRKILALIEEPLIVTARGGLLGRGHQYLTSYRGLAFHTKSKRPLPGLEYAQIIEARSIWMP